MKIIIAGSRDFNDYNLLEATMQQINNPIEEIVCGGAKGADTLGEQWAKNNNIPVTYFIPDWEKYGKSAGMIRNAEMGKYANALVAFWDGESKGTKNMIDNMEKLNKPYYIVKF